MDSIAVAAPATGLSVEPPRGAIVIMLQIAFRRSIWLTSAITLLTFLAAAISCIPAADVAPRLVTPLLQGDRLALLFCALFSLAGFVTTVLSVDYMKQRGDEPEEYQELGNEIAETR